MAFDLVLFDLGGVILEFDREAMANVWRDTGLAPDPGFDPFRSAFDFFRSAYEIEDGDHPIHRAERGEVSLPEFLALAEPLAPGISHLLDASRPTALQRFVLPSLAWADLVQEVKNHGFRTAVLSNTFAGQGMESAKVLNPGTYEHILRLFGEDVLESHVLGKRKPTRAAFLAAAEHAGVELERILFIDDHAANCEGATAAGLTSIHCSPEREESAREQVRQLLGLA